MTITINHHHYFHAGMEEELLNQFLLINTKLQQIMDSNQELLDKIAELATTVDSVQQQLSDANAAKDALIAQQAAQLEALGAAKAALETELANSVSPEQTQAAIAQIDAVIADVASTTAPTAPTETVVDPPVADVAP